MMTVIRWIAWALLLSFKPASATDFVPCQHNRPGDQGLRVLVEATYRNNQNTLMVQKALKRPETPIQGTPDQVDEIRWCQCVFKKKVQKLGQDLAISMSSLNPKITPLYEGWLKKLKPQEASAHSVDLWEIDATCFNESKR